MQYCLVDRPVETIRHITACMISAELYKMYAFGDLRFVYVTTPAF